MKKNLRLWLAVLLLSVFSFLTITEMPVFAEESLSRVVTDVYVDESELLRVEELLNTYAKEGNVDIIFYVSEDSSQLGYVAGEWESAVASEVEELFPSERSTILFVVDGAKKTAVYYTDDQADALISSDALAVITDHFLLSYFQKGQVLKGIEHSADLIDAVMRKRKIKVFDFAEVLTPIERTTLESRIGEVQDKYGIDIVYLLDENFGYDGEIRDFAADFYDYLGFGVGGRKDGLLYVQNFAERKFYTLGTGSCEDRFPSDLLDELEGDFVDNLKKGDFIGAYLEQVANFEAVLSGKYFSAENTKKFGMGVGISFLVAIALTVLAAFSQKIVVKKTEASEYIVSDGIVLNENIDRYTHTTTTREKIEKDNGSGGGGSFKGSSGTSHSGSGGSY